MHIHFLGICGTFMGSLAQLAKALGHQVSGSDANVYPPMSTQLLQAGIELHEGYDAEVLQPAPDLVIVGNAMSRGNPAVEYVLDARLPYCSGPQWLCEHVLAQRWVLAVSGTHGKTTTSSMLAWILEYAGMSPGFLIGGVPGNFDVSARLGSSDFFVIEADEYDSAFFDKRSKFVHYRPQTVVINNLEFDHADIFPDLAAIQTQFHHLLRTVPSLGLAIYPEGNAAVREVLDMGCWCDTQSLGKDWSAETILADGSRFSVQDPNGVGAEVCWDLNGEHNVANGLAAMAAARHVGVDVTVSAEALGAFKGVKRRLEYLGEAHGVKVYDDFAHHPTAIATTLAGVRAKVGDEKLIAVLEPRSNTMKMGVHKSELFTACEDADRVLCLQPGSMDWSLEDYASSASVAVEVAGDVESLVESILSTPEVQSQEAPCHIVIMSNGGFAGIHQILLERLNHV